MPQPSAEFGEELRRRRLAAGLSLTGLSAAVHYSKAQLSKVEQGIKLLDARAADGTHTADDLTDRWHAYLQHVLQAGPATGDDLRDLLASLQRLTHTAPGVPRATVHNDISGGTQHGPVIQSGRITGLTLRVHHPAGHPQD
ncbi:helix-turn-helix domain-containing protein [Streptomyces mooreae]